MSFFCPTEEQVRAQVYALLPRGRAWQTNEGGPVESFAVLQGKSKLWQYWASFANIMWFLHQRLCALRMEFWCATKTETFPEWMTEYGLPDECDPFPDLCTKVAAIGGTRCEYYAEVAARAGWTIECVSLNNDCGAVMGCAEIGDDVVGGLNGGAILQIIVHLNESPSYVAADEGEPYMGTFQIGGSLACAPDISALKCALERVVHAHIVIVYETTEV